MAVPLRQAFNVGSDSVKVIINFCYLYKFKVFRCFSRDLEIFGISQKNVRKANFLPLSISFKILMRISNMLTTMSIYDRVIS